MPLLALTLTVATVMIGAPMATPASAAPCLGGALNFVAHEDDDLIFWNPDILTDIRDGRCVRTVFVTAGDAGNPYPDSVHRERAPEAAYAQMAGVANNWTHLSDDGVGHDIRVEALVGAPNVSIAFLRIPDGFPSGQGSDAYQGQSLAELWNGSISSLTTVDGAETYTRTGLVNTLAAMMTDFQPSTIRTMDYVSPVTDADHSDHFMSAAFTKAADGQYGTSHTLMSYQGYPVGNRPQNVSGGDLQDKLTALQAASQFDPDAADPWVLDLARRRYVLDTSSGDGGAGNRAPVAHAGADQTVVAGASVQLTAAGSSDPDGDELNYAWTQTAGPTVSLSSATAARPTFTAPGANSSLTFSLVVADGSLNSAPDAVTITVPAAPPSGSTDVARTLGATATASTQNTGDGQTAAKAIDGSALGYPADYSHEWVTMRQGAGTWIQLDWTQQVILDHVVLHDRPNASDHITSATLTFSDGASVSVGALDNDGSAVSITFAPRTATWVRLTIDSVRPGGSNIGLTEFEAWGSTG